MKKLLALLSLGLVFTSCTGIDANTAEQIKQVASIALTLKEGNLTATEKKELTEQLIDSGIQLIAEKKEEETPVETVTK